MPLAQTITVFNKSGKVVSTSKQLVNVWKEAKAAYRERKAEIAAIRTIEAQEKHARKALEHIHLDDGDNVSRASSRRHRHAERPPTERGYTDSFYANDNAHLHRDGSRRGSAAGSVRSRHTTNHIRYDQDVAGEHVRGGELIRRHTDGEFLNSGREAQQRHSYARSSRSSIDMDLAYGDPPPLPVRNHTEEVVMREKMTKITMLLDEANALQHSVTSMIEHLQTNPDALAAVALTLAEVSNLAAKMGPGALMAMRGSFPAVVALLASPQFLIAGGLAIGVTVVMLGGFKIMKRVKDKPEVERELEAPLELQELETGELDRIEVWRRGIADAAAQSAGSIVDGEFITPGAEQLLIEEGVLDEHDAKSRRSDSRRKSSKTDKEKKREHKHRTSSKHGGSSRGGSTRGGSTVAKEDGRRKKAVSGLRMLFQGHSTTA